MSPFFTFALCLFASLFLPLAHADARSGPIVFPWSSQTYGPDGPWNAISLLIGQSSSVQVDLIPGGTYESYLLSPSQCTNSTFGSQNTGASCPAQKAGLYNDSMSSTSYSQPTWAKPNGPTGPPENRDDTSILVLDGVTYSTDWAKTQLVPNCSLVVTSSSWTSLPNGTRYPNLIGFFSLGAPEFNQSFGEGSGSPSLNASLYSSSLYESGAIQSSSLGLHIGAAGLNQQGSMIIGGYDMLRVYGQVASINYTPDGQNLPRFSIQLQDIWIDSYQNGSPFADTTRKGILSDGNSSLSTLENVAVDSTYPYMALPPSVCDSITRDLPVAFDPGLGLYLWNTKATNFSTVVNSASFLSFQFGLPDGSMLTIKAPWSLFNLTLSHPIASTPIQYFPCAPLNTSAYTLGRAFLQAAYFGVNWRPATHDGKWFLGQAPGPNVMSAPSVTVISNDDLSLSGSTSSWEDSWNTHWNTSVRPASNTTDSGSSDSQGDVSQGNNGSLSKGAIAGIAIGVIAILTILTLAAVFIFRRKRAAESNTAASPPSKSGQAPAPKISYKEVIPTYEAHLSELDTGRKITHSEATGHVPVYEMDTI